MEPAAWATVQYESTQTLGKTPLDMITRDFQEKLGAPNLSLTAKRAAAPQKVISKSKVSTDG